MYGGYAFEVSSRRTATIRSDHDIRRCPGGRARRLLAPVLRADAGSRCNRSTSSAGHGSLQHGHRLMRRAASKLTEKLPKARLCRDRMPRAARWASTSSVGRRRRPLARPGPHSSFLQSCRHARDLPRLPDRRRAGHRRLARHRDGRDRSVGGNSRPTHPPGPKVQHAIARPNGPGNVGNPNVSEPQRGGMPRSISPPRWGSDGTSPRDGGSRAEWPWLLHFGPLAQGEVSTVTRPSSAYCPHHTTSSRFVRRPLCFALLLEVLLHLLRSE